MAKKKTIDLPVSFGNLSVGSATARLGVTVARSSINLDDADATLCGHRLTAKIIGRAANGKADQESLPGMNDDAELTAVFDVKGFRVTFSDIGFGLVASLNDIDIAILSHFPTREGRVEISNVADLTEEEKGKPDENEPNGEDGAKKPRRRAEATP